MPRASIIRLPLDQRIAWPDCCCACLTPQPGDRYELLVRRWSVLDFVLPWFALRRQGVRPAVPMCSRCRPSILRWKRGRGALILGVAAAAFVAVLVWVPFDTFGLGQRWRPFLGMAVALVAVSPLLVWQYLRPPVFDVSVGRDQITFAFANARYAELFRSTNQLAAAAR
jgi:hypothetical protein